MMRDLIRRMMNKAKKNYMELKVTAVILSIIFWVIRIVFLFLQLI